MPAEKPKKVRPLPYSSKSAFVPIVPTEGFRQIDINPVQVTPVAAAPFALAVAPVVPVAATTKPVVPFNTGFKPIGGKTRNRRRKRTKRRR